MRAFWCRPLHLKWISWYQVMCESLLPDALNMCFPHMYIQTQSVNIYHNWILNLSICWCWPLHPKWISLYLVMCESLLPDALNMKFSDLGKCAFLICTYKHNPSISTKIEYLIFLFVGVGCKMYNKKMFLSSVFDYKDVCIVQELIVENKMLVVISCIFCCCICEIFLYCFASFQIVLQHPNFSICSRIFCTVFHYLVTTSWLVKRPALKIGFSSARTWALCRN